jgi:hypothetical protein
MCCREGSVTLAELISICGASGKHDPTNGLRVGFALHALLHAFARFFIHLQSKGALTVVGVARMGHFSVAMTDSSDLDGIHLVPDTVWSVPLLLDLLEDFARQETLILKRKRNAHPTYSQAKAKTIKTGVQNATCSQGDGNMWTSMSNDRYAWLQHSTSTSSHGWQERHI